MCAKINGVRPVSVNGHFNGTRAGINGSRRIVLYSHDTMGLGHMRRNLLIARTLVESDPNASVMLISGTAETTVFKKPPRVDYLTLPALHKEQKGDYRARSLGLTLPEIAALRGPTICAAVSAFAPDVMIVDNVPRGAVRELEPTLRHLRSTGTTRCILGLRDVLDAPDVVSREWRDLANDEAIDEYYDAIWVYGDAAVFDPVREYRWPANIAEKVTYTGYLHRCSDSAFTSGSNAVKPTGRDVPAGKYVLCMAGGGQDGADLMQAMCKTALPPQTSCLMVTGPFLPEAVKRSLHEHAARDSRFSVLEFLPEPLPLLERADKIIAMGGYNTVSEILSIGRPALIVPRVTPRQEQLIRAQRMQSLGLIDMMHPEDLCPDALSAWLAESSRQASDAANVIDFDGLARLPRYLNDILAPDRAEPREPLSVAYQRDFKSAVGSDLLVEDKEAS